MQSENEMVDDETVVASCGNIFADLELPDADLLLAKAKLGLNISKAVRERGLTQTQAAGIMGLTQPNVSDLMRGHLDRFTLDRLFRCLDSLGQEVEFIVRPKRVSADVDQTALSA